MQEGFGWPWRLIAPSIQPHSTADHHHRRLSAAQLPLLICLPLAALPQCRSAQGSLHVPHQAKHAVNAMPPLRQTWRNATPPCPIGVFCHAVAHARHVSWVWAGVPPASKRIKEARRLSAKTCAGDEYLLSGRVHRREWEKLDFGNLARWIWQCALNSSSCVVRLTAVVICTDRALRDGRLNACSWCESW